MFKKETIQAYQNIQAPPTLKASILEDEPKHHHLSPLLLGVCFIAVVFVFSPRFSLSVNQQKVTQNHEIISFNNDSLVRMASELLILDVDIKNPKSYNITVNSGELQESKEGVIWMIVEDINQTYTMTLKKKDKVYKVIMKYDDKIQQWTIKYEENKK